jgi:hypothetical protein
MKMVELILYVGQTPLRAGRVALAVILFRSDFEAYRTQGQSITGSVYVKASRPGEMAPPANLWQAVRNGLRWGAIEHRLLEGKLRRRDAEWIAAQWQNGVPV